MNREFFFKKLLPLLVSLVAVSYLATTIDVRAAFAEMTPHVALILIPSLLAYGAVSLLLEGMTLMRLMPDASSEFGLWTASRVKAASYLVALIHHAIGAGALSWLLRQRAGIGLVEAAGIVILIMMFDLGMLLVLVVLGITLMATHAPELQIGMILGVMAMMILGFGLLRAPFSLGPLDRLRNLELFRAARTTDTRRLVEAGGLRFLFVVTFQMLGWATFRAFGLSVPIGEFLVNFSAVALTAVLPSVAGIGPSQVAMVEFFNPFADRETLLACSIALSAGLILMRAGIGFLFAREYSREAYAAARDAEAQAES